MRVFYTKPELFEAIQQAMRRTARAYPNDADAIKRLSACMDVIHDASETAVPNILLKIPGSPNP